MFDPLDRKWLYNPEALKAQKALEAERYSNQSNQNTFGAGFAGGQDLSTDVGRQSWATSGLFGLLLSKLYSDEEQKEWFVQRNAINYEYTELERMIEAYRKIGETRDFSQEEVAEIEEMIARKNLLKEDLEFVYDNFDGNLDAPMDEDGKSFTDRWGLEADEEQGLLDLLKVFKDNPSYAGGVITAEVIKDLPFLGIAGLIGKADKSLSVGQIIAKINKKLGKIQSKTTRGLASFGTGVGSGAAIGAGYEAAYSTLEQGEVKGKETWLGAQFGGAFGILSGLGFIHGSGKYAKAASNLAEGTSIVTPPNKAIDNIRKAFKEEDDVKISEQANEVSILNDYEQEIKIIAGSKGDGAPALISTVENGRISTVLNKVALRAEHEEVKARIKKDPKTPRVEATLTNPDAYKAMRIAQEKARLVIRMNNEKAGIDATPEKVEEEAYRIALEELNRVDREFVGPTRPEQINEATQLPPRTPEEQAVLEAQKIAKNRMDGEEPAPEVPSKPSRLMQTIEKYPKSMLAAGAGLGYALSDEEAGRGYGALLGAGAVFLGPKVGRLVTTKSLKAATIKAKVALSQSIEAFSVQSKKFEYEMQLVIDEINEVFPDGKGAVLIDAIEDPSIKFAKGSRELEVQRKVETLLDMIGKEAVGIGLIRPKGSITRTKFGQLNDEGIGAMLNNYFPHMFKREMSDKEIQELVNTYLRETKNIKERTLKKTIAWINENKKDRDIITDPAHALSLYTQAMTRTIYAKNLINSLLDLSVGATGVRHLPAMMHRDVYNNLRKTEAKHGGINDQEALHYMEFEHPTLKDYVAHSDIHPLINDQFALLRRGGVGEVMEGILKLNNGLKRIFVFGSLFHAQALMLSAAYSLGAKGLTGKPLGGKIKVRDKDGKPMKDSNGDNIYRQGDFSDLKIGSMEFKELAMEAIHDGLQIINIKKADLINPGFQISERVFEKLGFVGKNMSKVFEKTDYLTWQYFHDRFKLATYMQKKKAILDDLKAQNIDTNNADIQLEAGKLAARFANDAYGSLDWNDFATRLYKYAENNPDKLRGIAADRVASILPVDKRRWLNLGLFAPDWTVSNIRIVGNTFVSGYKLSNHLIKAIHRGDDAAWKSKEGRMLLSAFKMYVGYSARAAMITSGMWWGISEINDALFDDAPKASMDNLFDFWFGEASGKLQLGGGESMVISKQIAEPIHWVQHWNHTLLNKSSVIPKTVIEGMFNKQWFSMKKGFPMGPEIIDSEGVNHTPQWILGKAVPIVTKPLFDSKLSWGERLERTFSGFFGFPQYTQKGNYN